MTFIFKLYVKSMGKSLFFPDLYLFYFIPIYIQLMTKNFMRFFLNIEYNFQKPQKLLLNGNNFSKRTSYPLGILLER